MTKKEDQHVDYFEAIIQLRPATDEIISFIRNQCKKRNERISRATELKTGGLDLYITSQKLARTIGAKLKKSFGGELIISKKMHTTDRLRMKQLYRATVLFRPIIKPSKS